MGTEISSSNPVASAESEEQSLYLSLLDRQLSSLAEKQGATLESVISGARGAYPTLIRERLRLLGLEHNLPSERPTILSEVSSVVPELHPLDFEWYFTPDCADYLAELLTRERVPVLCMGAPTVAAAISRRGREVLLLDNNPLIAMRLPGGITPLKFMHWDLYVPLPEEMSFPVMFFDAPWYPESISLWLRQASQASQVGGLIAFSLFPPLLRPGAVRERDQILEQAQALGKVEIQEEVLFYETPLFEWSALARCGIRTTTNWRRGDLVLIRVAQKPVAPPPPARILKEAWESFLVGSQVVKLRRPTHGSTDKILAPLTDCPDFVFTSVSLRDPRRDQIDLWTSRNRVARVGRRELVAAILCHMSQGLSIEQVAKQSELSSLNAGELQELLTSLHLMLEKPLEENHGATHNRDEIP